MNDSPVPDREIDAQLQAALRCDPPGHLEQRIAHRLDGFRALHERVQRRTRRGLAWRAAGGLALVALVNGAAPRTWLGVAGRWLEGLERWTVVRDLPEPLLTVHAQLVVAVLLVLADEIARLSATSFEASR